MNKIKLKKLFPIRPADNFLQMAEELQRNVDERSKDFESYNFGIYMSCGIENEILKIAFFLGRDLCMGSNIPIYQVFVQSEKRDFLTWDENQKKWRNAKVDNLEWPRNFMKSDIHINNDDNLLMKQYLRVEYDGYEGLLRYQENIREEQLEIKRRKKINTWGAVMNLVPELPKDWEKWVDRHAIHNNFIFYDYIKKGAKEGYCTHCKKIVPIYKPKHNAMGTCKCCRTKVQFKSKGRAGRIFTEKETAYLLQKCGNGFVLRCFSVWRGYTKGNYEIQKPYCKEERRIVYDGKLNGTPYYVGYYAHAYRWRVGEMPYSSYNANVYRAEDPGAVYQRTITYLERMELKRTGLSQFIKALPNAQPALYLEVLKRKPYLELVVKSGLLSLAYELVSSNQSLNIEPSHDFAKALKIDKNRMSRLRKYDGGFIYLTWLRYEKQKGICLNDEEIKFFERNCISPEELDFISNRISIKKICNYLIKQYKMSGRPPKELVSTWQDYISMTSRLHMDLEDELICKPKNLIKSHDDTVKICGGKNIALRAAELLKDYPDLDSICQDIKAKYEYGDDKFILVGPSRIEDILMEGNALGHCLDSSDIYFDRIQRRESYILFLRKTKNPETPYYTLEIEPGGTVRQKRTIGDKQNDDIKKAERFLEKWQMKIQSRLTVEDKCLAKESVILRIREFEKLREDRTTIWRGRLAGKLLVDVLEEDLMEAAFCAEENNDEEIENSKLNLSMAS